MKSEPKRKCEIESPVEFRHFVRNDQQHLCSKGTPFCSVATQRTCRCVGEHHEEKAHHCLKGCAKVVQSMKTKVAWPLALSWLAKNISSPATPTLLSLSYVADVRLVAVPPAWCFNLSGIPPPIGSAWSPSSACCSTPGPNSTHGLSCVPVTQHDISLTIPTPPDLWLVVGGEGWSKPLGSLAAHGGSWIPASDSMEDLTLSQRSWTTWTMDALDRLISTKN